MNFCQLQLPRSPQSRVHMWVMPSINGINGILHVLVITGSGVGLVSGDVEDVAHGDGDILVADSVTGTDLRTLGVESNGQRTTSLNTGSLAGMVDDRLVVLLFEVSGGSFHRSLHREKEKNAEKY